MTLLGLPLAQLAALFGAAAAAVTLLYILRLRRRQSLVSFAQLWARVLEERESTSLFRRLKRLLSLLLQLLLLFLLVAALADPRLSGSVLAGRQVVLLIDSSASMQTQDTSQGTRLDSALTEARQLIRGMGGADLLMVVRLDAQVTPLGGFESDDKVLLKQLEDVQATDTRADLLRGLRFAADALRGKKNPQLILIGDGAYPAEVLQALAVAPAGTGTGTPLDGVDLSGIDLRFVPVGQAADNVGIVAFNARRYPRNKLSFEIFLEVVNYQDRPVEADLQLYVDGELLEVERLTLHARERARYTCDPEGERGKQLRSWCQLAASGELLEARLATPGGGEDAPALDAFSRDDRAFAILPRLGRQRVLLVTSGNLYLEGALLLNDNLELAKTTPAAYDPTAAARADALVFDGVFPAEPPSRPFLVIDHPHKGGAYAVEATLSEPLITEQDREHPVMRWITLKDVNISQAVSFARGPGVSVLAASFRRPLIVASQRDGLKSVAVGFDVTRSDLPLRVAFPLLVANSLDWFAGSDESLLVSYRTGEAAKLRLPLAAGDPAPTRVEVSGPLGGRFSWPVQQGRVELYGEHVGRYTLRFGAQQLIVAANLADPLESDIRPRSTLALAGRALAPPEGFRAGLRRELWVYLVSAALALLLLEWLTYNRRLTV